MAGWCREGNPEASRGATGTWMCLNHRRQTAAKRLTAFDAVRRCQLFVPYRVNPPHTPRHGYASLALLQGIKLLLIDDVRPKSFRSIHDRWAILPWSSE